MKINRKQIWSLTWPVILANLTIPLVGLTDTIIMGHMPDSKFLAGIAIGSIVFNFVYGGLNFLRMGTTGIVAQELGKKNNYEILYGLFRPLIFSLLIGLILYSQKSLILDITVFSIKPEEQIIPILKVYLFTRILGLPIGLMNMVFLGWFFGMQKAKSVMLQLIVINLINIFSSILFAQFLNLGIFGVALGSVVAQFFGFITSVLIFINYLKNETKKQYDFKQIFLIKRLQRLFNISFDLFLRTIFLISAQAYMIYKAGLLGIDQLAALEIIIIIFGISSYSLDGFAHTAETMVGKAIGSKNNSAIKKAIFLSTQMAFIMSLIISFILFCFEYWITFLITDIIVLREIIDLLWIFVVFTPVIAVFAFQLDGIFVGATLSRQMRNSMIIAFLIFYIVVEYIFQNKLNLQNLYISFLLFLFLRALLLILSIKKVFILKDGIKK